MKAGICIVAMSLLAGAAMAQQGSSPQQQQPQQMPQGQTTRSSTADQNAGKSSTSGSAPSEMKTQTYKGVLVDMSCAGSGTSSTDNTANRSAADQGGSCPVTANSSHFGLKTKDGRTLRFDIVGDQRTQEALKNNKKWNKEMTDGKQINATVQGAVSGDKLIVSAIH